MNENYYFTDDHGVERTLSVTGHRMLVRKCELDGDNFLIGEAGKVEIPEEFLSIGQTQLNSLVKNYRSYVCEVLAVGPLCGRARDRMDWKRLNRNQPVNLRVARHLNNPAEPGDFVILPERSLRGRMWVGVTGRDYDILVDECEVIAVYRGGADAA